MLGYAVKSGQLKDHPLRGVQLLRAERPADGAGRGRVSAALRSGERGAPAGSPLGVRHRDAQGGSFWASAGSRRISRRAPSNSLPKTPGGATGHRPDPASQRSAPHPPLAVQEEGFVFVNPKTKTRRVDIKKSFRRAVAAAELPGLWFHELRRSFITRARRVGVPEKRARLNTGRVRSGSMAGSVVSRCVSRRLECLPGSSTPELRRPWQRAAEAAVWLPRRDRPARPGASRSTIDTPSGTALRTAECVDMGRARRRSPEIKGDNALRALARILLSLEGT